MAKLKNDLDLFPHFCGESWMDELHINRTLLFHANELGIFEILFTTLVARSGKLILVYQRLWLCQPGKNPFPASFFVTFLGW